MQLSVQTCRIGVALVPVGGQAAGQDGSETGDCGVELTAGLRGQQGGGQLLSLVYLLFQEVLTQEVLAEGHPADDQGQREQVRATVHLLFSKLFGRHVGRRAPPRHRPTALQHRDAEVGDLHSPVPGDQDVGGFQVAVHETGRPALLDEAMSLGQSRSDPYGDLQDNGRRDVFPCADQLSEGESLDELQRDEQLARDRAQLVDIDDVRVLESAANTGLVYQVLAAYLPTALGLDDLDGHLLAEARWALEFGAEDTAHSALAEDGLELVASEAVGQAARAQPIGRQRSTR